MALPERRAAAAFTALLHAAPAAALEHAHLLTLHPRDAASGILARLADAGWTTPGIVTLSRPVTVPAFQVRVVAGLRALALSRAILAA